MESIALLKPHSLKPIIFAGPSGVGKGTIIDMLKSDYPEKFAHSVSHTTRKPRDGEVDGVHYHFIALDTFNSMFDEGKFIERAMVHNNMYGTTYAAVETVRKTGKLCLLDLDIEGCISVRRVGFDAFIIFIEPPSLEELENRLRIRGKETPEQIAVRLNTAKKEMERKQNLNIWDLTVPNEDLNTCYNEIKNFIDSKEGGILTGMGSNSK